MVLNEMVEVAYPEAWFSNCVPYVHIKISLLLKTVFLTTMIKFWEINWLGSFEISWKLGCTIVIIAYCVFWKPRWKKWEALKIIDQVFFFVWRQLKKMDDRSNEASGKKLLFYWIVFSQNEFRPFLSTSRCYKILEDFQIFQQQCSRFGLFLLTWKFLIINGLWYE
jgi:hypothetical protein